MEISYILNYIRVSRIDGIVQQIELNHSGDWFEVPFKNESEELTKELREWEKNNYQITPTDPDWIGLLGEVRGSELFGKIYTAAKDNSQISPAFNLLVSTLNSSNPNVQDLQFALQDIKTLMGDTLTIADIDLINQLLVRYNIPFRL